MGPGSRKENGRSFEILEHVGARAKEGGWSPGGREQVYAKQLRNGLRRPVTGTASLIHESGAWTWMWLADMQSQ